MSVATSAHDEKSEAGSGSHHGHGDEFLNVLTTGPSEQVADPPTLPQLDYNLWDYKTKLFLICGLLVLEMSVLPIVLFYSLWYCTTLRHGIIFAIITSFYGFVTGIEFALRCWRLIMPSDEFRPLGARRWRFDFTHWTMSFGYTIMTGILIGPSIPHEPLVRPLAMPVPFFLIQLGAQMFVFGVLHARKARAPFRISSIAKGERVQPLLYTFVEDIVGVDGAGGRSYRRRFKERYEASPRFRVMIAQLNWFWAVGGLVVGSGLMALLFALPSQEIAYGVAWGAPLGFVLLWFAVTLHWVRRSLRNEKRLWDGGDVREGRSMREQAPQRT